MERIADEEKIEEKELAERIVAEPVKQIPEIVEEELEPELQELKEYFEAERRVENGEEEGATDYEKFIDEELQEFLPALIAKEIPEEPRAMPREISRNAADLYEKIDRPRKPEEARRAKEEEVMVSTKVKRIFSRKSADVCDDTCPLIKEQKGELIFQKEEKRQYCRLPRSIDFSLPKNVYIYILHYIHTFCNFIKSKFPTIVERIMRKLKERQRVVDHYRLTKGFSYFEDVCTCSLACMVYTLSKDPFVRSVFASLALFAVGLKLCSELDAWEMPSRVS
ncbi:uncharacterized protein LOC114940790 [Nylanderia fulva]|uniref:uncharacterized protein LOC114940790 n=1 Tax=Nylanderia fulva TaxID=613905 RepID=UPI0010FB9FD8|nr:uncharacterized protein LOC114940790 [Nylanderia fulva]